MLAGILPAGAAAPAQRIPLLNKINGNLVIALPTAELFGAMERICCSVTFPMHPSAFLYVTQIS